MKNIQAKHDWKVTGAYDPEADGPDPQWGRRAIRCRICGEERRVFCSLDEPAVAYGCRRYGGDKWRRGDFLVHESGGLDRFDCWLPDGRVQTYNGGGWYRESDRPELQPYG
jgi:hypothetical protein